MGKCGAGIVFAQQGKRAPDYGGTGVDRETYPRSLVGSGVYDSRVVPVVGAVGSDLGGCGLVGLDRVAITRLITRPMRSRYQRAASWRAGRQRKEQSGSPALPPHMTVIYSSKAHNVIFWKIAEGVSA